MTNNGFNLTTEERERIEAIITKLMKAYELSSYEFYKRCTQTYSEEDFEEMENSMEAELISIYRENEKQGKEIAEFLKEDLTKFYSNPTRLTIKCDAGKFLETHKDVVKIKELFTKL